MILLTVNKFIYKYFFMSGQELKEKLERLGVNYADLATALGLKSRQALHNRFKTDDVGIGFLQQVAGFVNKNIYFFIENDNISGKEAFVKTESTRTVNETNPVMEALTSAVHSLGETNALLLKQNSMLQKRLNV